MKGGWLSFEEAILLLTPIAGGRTPARERLIACLREATGHPERQGLETRDPEFRWKSSGENVEISRSSVANLRPGGRIPPNAPDRMSPAADWTVIEALAWIYGRDDDVVREAFVPPTIATPARGAIAKVVIGAGSRAQARAKRAALGRLLRRASENCPCCSRDGLRWASCQAIDGEFEELREAIRASLLTGFVLPERRLLLPQEAAAISLMKSKLEIRHPGEAVTFRATEVRNQWPPRHKHQNRAMERDGRPKPVPIAQIQRLVAELSGLSQTEIVRTIQERLGSHVSRNLIRRVDREVNPPRKRGPRPFRGKLSAK